VPITLPDFNDRWNFSTIIRNIYQIYYKIRPTLVAELFMRTDKETGLMFQIILSPIVFLIQIKNQIFRTIFEKGPNNPSIFMEKGRQWEGERERERGTDVKNLTVEFRNFLTKFQMCFSSTEDVRNFWSSYRQWRQYQITLCEVKTAIHAVYWQTQTLWLAKVPVSNTTQKFNHSESQCGIVC
jgi:hypothetical protein